MFALSLCFATVLVGCATNPSKEVKDTRIERSGDITDHREETTDVYAKDEIAVEKAEDELVKTTDKLDSNLDVKLVANDKRGASAHADVSAARKTFRTEGDARITRVEANIADLVFQQRKPLNQQAILNVKAQIKSVRAAIAKLDAVGDERWFKAMQEVDANIASLEVDAAKVGS